MIKKINKITTLIFMLFVITLFPKTVQALEELPVKRLSGANRYDTAVSISKSGWNNSDYVVLASGENFPDAITSTPLAKLYDAPILLTRKSQLLSQTKNEIARLKCKNVFIIGGTGVISNNVETQLKNMKINVRRLGGLNRYETSILVSNEIKKKSPVSKIVVVSGDDYTSTESIAPIAAVNKFPIILTVQNRVPDCVKKFVLSNKIDETYLVGTDEQFSSEVKNVLPNVKFIHGQNKYDVNLNVINLFKDKLNFNKIYVATGQNYPDALAASALASKDTSPLFLAGDKLYPSSENFINSMKAVNKINLIGGEKILSSYAVKNIKIHNEYEKNKENDNSQNQQNKTQEKLIICLDPGQEQSYTQGMDGIKASDVNLNVALKAGSILKNKGYKVIYTRTNDNVPWDSQYEAQEKFKIANQNKADVFVSIHCNYTENNKDANGIETWYNSSSQKSKMLAQYLQDNLIKNTSSSNRLLKVNGQNGNQPILNNTNLVSALVELGFLSNDNEEKRLGSNDFQEKASEAIVNAILKYDTTKDRDNNISDNTSDNTSNSAPENYKVDDVIKHIKVGDKFTLPQSVSKIMTDGTKKQLNVKWDNTKVDTSKAGIFTYSGVVTEYNQRVCLALIINTSASTKYKVCIDPGHGGYDSGAIGSVKKVQEKTVTLPVGLKLGNLLVKNGVDVYFTRVSDNVCWPSSERLDLQKRCNISNSIAPDLYISIHCNSSMPTVYGIETFYCESNNANNSSRKLAQCVQNELVKEISSNDRGVKTNIFYVNKYVNCPSVLTELGFLSNSNEETKLNSDSFQNKYAQALYRGISQYLKSK